MRTQTLYREQTGLRRCVIIEKFRMHAEVSENTLQVLVLELFLIFVISSFSGLCLLEHPHAFRWLA